MNQLTKSNSGFFGPKLVQNQGSTEQQEVANVKFVETNAYNYGVPQQVQINKKNKSLTRKTVMTKSNVLGSIEQHPQASSIVTADIYVYARKRPKLPSEIQFNDAVLVENSECITEQNKYSIQSKSICVNELKSAVDGTPVLRKV